MFKKSKTVDKELENTLNAIAREGILADARRLKEDMCAQFADYREWIREYVVNAYDAGAKHCTISGYEKDQKTTIVVEDDGAGLDRQGIIDFNIIYRSVKKGKVDKTIGRHGIGKLSVASIPGQCGFLMVTSTGDECWRVEAGCLLDDTPINIERIEPVPKAGTRFEITFESITSLRGELRELTRVLERYVRFLPMTIVVREPDWGDTNLAPAARWICGSWNSQDLKFPRTYEIDGEVKAEVVFGLGEAVNEVYQNRVLISDRYNLLIRDMNADYNLAGLTVRVDSPDFELPFGRHCLSNDESLDWISERLKDVLFPRYLEELCVEYEAGRLLEAGVDPHEVEDLVCQTMLEKSFPGGPWNHLRIFATKSHGPLSYENLCGWAEKNRDIYIEDVDDPGIDYSYFEAPVFAWDQPKGGHELIKSIFGDFLVNLSHHDVVLEAPGADNTLGPLELNFQKFLAFHPEALKMERREGVGKDYSDDDEDLARGMITASKRASDDLSSIRWRLSYLVTRDGKTPCKTRRYLAKNNEVILNLHHPEIMNLLKLSEKAPTLAGHWALAMCLAEDNRILPYLTPETREDLLLVDAMAKCCGKEKFCEAQAEKKREGQNSEWNQFLRDLRNESKWLH